MESMERFTSLYAIAYAILKSMENVRFDKEGYFQVLVFYTGYFIKEIENISPCLHTVIETLVKVWENLELRGNTRTAGSCSHFNFSFSQTSTRFLRTVWKHGKCFLFLKCQWNTWCSLIQKQKGLTLSDADIIFIFTCEDIFMIISPISMW